MEKLFERNWNYHPFEFRIENDLPEYVNHFNFSIIDTHAVAPTVTAIHSHLDKDFVLLQKSTDTKLEILPNNKESFMALVKRKTELAPYGLILVGGKSERMGRDKFSLELKGKTLVQLAYEKLSAICPQVFISCRENQKDEAALKPFPQIHDRFMSLGPSGGIMSAQILKPERPWIVLACDLANVSMTSLNFLVQKRDPLSFATCFSNTVKRGVDPLCALYEPKSLVRFFEFIALGNYCPRKMLNNSKVALLDISNISNKDELMNFNTPEEFSKLASQND